MSFLERLVTLKLTSAVVIDGLIHRAGTLVEMVEDEAKSLLRLGKAELHGVTEGKTDSNVSQTDAAQAAADAAAQQAAPVTKAKASAAQAALADTKGR
jgi:hypothetical protein